MLKKINDYLYKVSDIKFILIMLITSFLIIIPLEPILILTRKLFGELGGPTILKSISFLWKIIILSLLIPFIETLLWQKLPIEIMQKKDFFKSKPILIASISSIVFALNHYYDLAYVIIVLPIGLILAYSYIVYQTKESKLTPFKVVFIIHMLRNTITTLVS